MWIGSRRRILFLTLIAAVDHLVAVRPPHAQERASLAIAGYDPVAYFALGKPTPGLPEFEQLWDEHRYRFARAEHREMFRADPVRYAPQFPNFCAMALARGQLVEADPENWLISDGRLYLFAKPVGAELFRQGLAGNIDKARDHWPGRPAH